MDKLTSQSAAASWVVVLICSFVVAFGAGLWFFLDNKDAAPNVQKPVACTMEAKQCPDGSYVGRTGPNCEFNACP